MKKHYLDRSDCRPDIIHEVLVRLLGRRLNLAGGIQAVYIKTIEGHLIKIELSLCVPRTLKGFCAMMSQLYQKFSIKGSERSKCRKLLHIIQNPVAIHLPVGSQKIGLSSTSSKAVNLWELFDTIVNDRPLVFVIGAMAHGKIDSEYTDNFISVLSYYRMLWSSKNYSVLDLEEQQLREMQVVIYKTIRNQCLDFL